MVNDLIPLIRAEATLPGQDRSFPFLLDITIQAWNGELVEKAGLDPAGRRRLGSAHREREEGRQLRGGAVRRLFDAHAWRSLAPIAHTFNTNVEGRTGCSTSPPHPAVVQALEATKQLMEVAPKNILEEGKVDGGVNTMPDEEAFAGRQAAYYVKYQNAPTRFAGTWPDPSVLRHRRFAEEAGRRRWHGVLDTGAALFKYGQNKKQAADYMSFLTHYVRIWQHALGKDVRGASGQPSPYKSDWVKWKKSPPTTGWPHWAFTVQNELKTSKAIRTHSFGLTQFVLGKPAWEAYLKGDEKNPKKALAKAQAIVLAEVKKQLKNSGLLRSTCSLLTRGGRRWLAEPSLPGSPSGHSSSAVDHALRADVAVPAAGAVLLRRLAAVPHRSYRMDLVHELQLPARRLTRAASWVWFHNYADAFPDPLVGRGLLQAAIFTAVFLPG